ncbi:MAG TPA: MmgE/PrpD family protein [Kofleriaceae bacterium]|jgi:2-methylcitrate dehydratase PrpD|nr:MmgE/PrpD family protein [Kofleriaceae bacterium]
MDEDDLLPGSLSRRSLLKLAGGAVAAAATALPSRPARAAAADDAHRVIDRLSSYMADAGGRALPADALEHTKHHVLDTLAAMISGVNLPPGKTAIAFARASAGAPPATAATVAGSDVLCGPLEAAMANGMLAHSDETDDSHAPSHSHPGCAVVPAALAAGERFGIDGARLLRAVALGYDVGPRVTATLGGLPFQIKTHHSAHSIAGTFGAAAAAACAAGLAARQMRWVLDYAAQQASGVAAWQRDEDHIEKALVFGGFPARNGVSAALIIQLGGTGVADIFSGDDNFLTTFAPTADPGQLIDKLGDRFEVGRTNIKKWTVGSPIQAPLDALTLIRKRRPFTADDVQSVTVRVATSEAKTVNDREIPSISLQHMVAVMLIDRTVTFDAAHDKPRMQDPAVLRQKAKVRLAPDEELERLYPRREAVVELVLTDGTKLVERVGAVRGTSDNPMSRDEVAAKARDLMTPMLGGNRAQRLIETVWTLEAVKDVRNLRPLLQRR